MSGSQLKGKGVKFAQRKERGTGGSKAFATVNDGKAIVAAEGEGGIGGEKCWKTSTGEKNREGGTREESEEPEDHTVSSNLWDNGAEGEAL